MDPVLAPGDVCGDHQVLRLLGSGGFAQVYEVRDRQGARRALKILSADADARPKLRARLAQEGAALTLLDHANVVRFHGAGLDGERLYLLLELVEGQTLQTALRAQPRPPLDVIARWIGQAAEGVAAAHRHGIIHRDLKPENLLLSSQGVIKVIDFGLAKLSDWGLKTTVEQKLGTALYMSPEQIRAKPPDPRMDVYALGLVLYEGLAGRHALVTRPMSMFDICNLQLNEVPRPLCELAPQVPRALGAVADRAIQKDPALRFQDMRAFADALQAALVQGSQPQRDALRNLAPPGGRGSQRAPVAGTQPMSVFTEPVPAAPSAPAAALAAPVAPTAPLARTAADGGPLPFAVTAAVRAQVPGEIVTPPQVNTWLPSQMESRPPPAPALVPPLPARRKRVSVALVVCVILAAAVGLPAGVWVMMRLLP
jgi:eukaryotic-like serine/threonine-protein kinase